MTRSSRRAGIAAALSASAGLAATVVAGCSSGPGPGAGWDRPQDGSLALAVPSGWDRTVPQSGLWTTRWTDPSDSSSVLMTAQSVTAADVYQALDLAMNAARAVTRGYRPVGERTALSDGSTLLARQDYQTSWPYESRGTTWAVGRGLQVALVDLSGQEVTDSQVETVERWIELL
ncbi:hypothetical protein D5R93_12170 [Actinomyces lilanjuaniae]|uniref:Uncharacterized protein n=1 Tax=Actinomyces lilanjuaniae TaxID=2321394 RepID=A0ABM6Z5G7_9ACTO|nr:hypothetical protein [Actinomyces lilanjuaniae]AYD90565.1 hypothetical protein D5R93_12170 [Actinomyces lilanjuaniae]